GTAGTVVTYVVPTVSDADPQPSVVCNPQSGTTFPYGRTTVTCVATDHANNSSSISFTVTLQDTIGPVVDKVVRVLSVNRKRVQQIVLTFSEQVDSVLAVAPSNYELFFPGKDKRLGTADDQAITLGSAPYDPAATTVSVTPIKPCATTQSLQIVARGLTDLAGNSLDGDGNGIPGADFIVMVGTRFSYVDGDGDIVSFTLAKGGVMQLRRGTDG